MDKLSKPKRVKNKDNLNQVKKTPCIICKDLSDPCHIRSRGAGGGDEKWNLIPLCRKHHTEQHQIGWHDMAYKYWQVMVYLTHHGWELFDKKLRRRRTYLGQLEHGRFIPDSESPRRKS